MIINRNIFLLVFTVLACAPETNPSYMYSSSLAQHTSPILENQDSKGLQDNTLQYLFDRMSCSDFRSQIWSHVYLTLFGSSLPPPPSLVQKKIKNYAQEYLALKGGQPGMVRRFSQTLSDVYRQAFQFFSDKTEETILEQLKDIEYLGDLSENNSRDYIDREVIEFVQNISPIFDELKKIIRPLNLPCLAVEIDPENFGNIDSAFLLEMRSSLHPVVYGARKVMTTAYQSCQVLQLPLISHSYSGVQGILKRASRSGNHYIRNIADLSKVNRTHYYLQSQNSSSDQCLDISKKPLIFDYGGKPLVNQLPYPTINLFRNAGSGSRVLGLDCSGFVLSALASAGLRVQKNKPIRGFHISGISSWDFRRASRRLSCFKKVNPAFKNPIAPGDIIASNGHVLIVDQVSNDPLGLFQKKSRRQCSFSKISSQQFNFSAIQSSAIFNGIGINRIHIRDIDHPQMLKGLRKFASYSCYKKFGRKSSNNRSDVTILRHSLSQNCREMEMRLAGQECLSSCSSYSQN